MFTTVLAAVLIASLVLLTLASLAAERLIRQHHAQKIDFFNHYPIRPGDIVFLGDSLMDGARWDELLPGWPVKNRGINNDTTRGVLARLDSITSGRPAAVFLLIGTNDLPWYRYRRDAAILATYETILQRLRQDSPGTRVFVQSLLPRHRRYAGRIAHLNAGLEALAERYGMTYVALHPHFVDANGEIQAQISNDRLHLLGEGYARWIAVIRPHIEALSAAEQD